MHCPGYSEGQTAHVSVLGPGLSIQQLTIEGNMSTQWCASEQFLTASGQLPSVGNCAAVLADACY